MTVWEGLAHGFGVALQPDVLIYCLLGVSLGTFIGVLPGIGAMAAISLLLPITFYISPEAALVMLAGVYYGAQYGGAVASILLRLPGTPQSAVTTLDGYPMAQQGRAGVALFVSMVSSFAGSMLGIVVLVVLAGWLSEVATSFRSAEYAAMMVLGLVAASTIGSDRPAKAFAMVTLGLILGCVGTDVNSGAQRFTFGIPELMDGINLVALAMGLFGVAEVIGNIRNAERQAAPERVTFRKMMPTRDDLRRMPGATLRGTALGSFFGALPGTGSTLSSFLSYAVERRVARHPERFGNGAVEGVAGPEAANNASAAGTLVPLLTLGLPTSATAAIMLAGFQQFGLQPGPLLFATNPTLVWGLIASLLIANFMLLVLNLPLIGLWVKLLTVPKPWLYAGILLFATLGTIGANPSTFELGMLLGFGVLGYAMRLFGYPIAPIVVGLILGPMAEQQLRRALSISQGDWSYLVQSPIAAVLLGIAALALIVPLILRARGKGEMLSQLAGDED